MPRLDLLLQLHLLIVEGLLIELTGLSCVVESSHPLFVHVLQVLLSVPFVFLRIGEALWAACFVAIEAIGPLLEAVLGALHATLESQLLYDLLH